MVDALGAMGMDMHAGDKQKEFRLKEERDGVRMSWNVFPNDRHEMGKLGLPVGALYSPFKVVKPNTVAYDPVVCVS